MPEIDDSEHEDADDFLLDEFDSDGAESADDPDHSGLELGEAQADEIRQIFKTTLPQYLEPLEELVEQALAQAEPEPAIIATLNTTVASIIEAAQRIGVDDIAASLADLQTLIGELAVSDPDEVAAELRGTLHKIKVQSGATAPRQTSETIVSALAAVEGFDTSILESLTVAGLVTVAQLRMARKYEIIAVTGLSVEAVDGLLAALGIEEAPTSGAAARSAGGELRRHFQTQVEAEGALSEARVGVQRARARIALLAHELERANAATVGLREREADAAAHLIGLVQARASSQKALAKLVAERAELEQKGLAARERLSRLDLERARVRGEQEELREKFAEIGEGVGLLLAMAGEAAER